MEDRMVEYLTLIQEPISRMSTISAVLKGFAATSVVGLILKDSPSFVEAFLIGVLLMAFLCIDIYYLRLEKQFRYLFKQVVEKKHPVDFSMELPNTRKDMVSANATFFACFKSRSIWPFYVPMLCCIAYIAFCSRG